MSMILLILIFFVLMIVLLGAAIVFIVVRQRQTGGTSPPSTGERMILRAESTDSSHMSVSLKPESDGTSRDETTASGTIGNYELISELGEGGMGIVYKARQASLDRIVALKVLLPNLSRKDRFVQRFMREAKNAATLDHPNIVTIYEVGEHDGSYYFSMKYVEGEDLDQLVEDGALSVDDASAIALQVAGGLAHAHQRGVVHRDIKPANIILDTSGRAVITDFGIARAAWEERMTSTGMAVGTVEYMSPEQFKGGDVDERSDVYALAATFYTLLTGSSPFPGATTQEVMYRKFKEAPTPPTEVNPSLPAWVDRVIARAMADDPADRYPTTDDFARDIRAGLEGTLEAAPGAPVGEKEPEEKPEAEGAAAPAPAPEDASPPPGDGEEVEAAAEGEDLPATPIPVEEGAAPEAGLLDAELQRIDRTGRTNKNLFILLGVLAALFLFILGTIGFWVMKNRIIPSLSSGGTAPGGGSPSSGGGMFGVGGCSEYLDESIIRSVFSSRANEDGYAYDLMNVYYFEGSFTGPNMREAIVTFEDYNQSNASEVSEVWLFSCKGGWHDVTLVIEGDYCDVYSTDVNGDGVSEVEAYVSNYSTGFGGTAYYLFSLREGYVNTIYNVFGEDQLGTPGEWAYVAEHTVYYEDYDGNGIMELVDNLTYSYYSYDYYYNEWDYQSEEYYTYIYTFGVDEYGDLYLGTYDGYGTE